MTAGHSAAIVKHQAIALPGGVLPAELAYGALLEALAGHDVEVIAKDLEVYATPAPRAGYSLDTEAEGVRALQWTCG
jgi:hypothetical protein